MKYMMILCVAAAVMLGCGAEEPAARPEKWAAPMTCAGVPNLHKVSDKLYRSAQPTAEGMTNLVALGIKTVVNLRDNHSDSDEIGGLPLKARRIEIFTGNMKDKYVTEFLSILDDTNAVPVLVHCQHGADRTGTMCAMYRILREGWTADDAIDEMKNGGYGYHSIWGNLPRFIRKSSERLKAQASGDAPAKLPSRVPHYDGFSLTNEVSLYFAAFGQMDFAISTTEVPQALWYKVMGDNPSEKKGPNLPVENVSWSDCMRFVAKLSESDKMKGSGVYCDLPTEAEWELACRAGSKGDWGTPMEEGKGTAKDMAWTLEDGKNGEESAGTHPVGQKQPNALWIFDMHGNVAEWCRDELGFMRVIRGGSWLDEPSQCTASSRQLFMDGYRRPYIGLRVVVRKK